MEGISKTLRVQFLVLVLALTFLHAQTTASQNKTFPDLKPMRGVVRKGVNLKILAVSTPEKIQKGKALFSQFACFVCHGFEGKGDGPAGLALNPRPTNFTKSPWHQGTDFSSVFRSLTLGVPKTGMSSYENIPIKDRIAIVHYLRSLVKEVPKVTTQELDSLEKEFQLGDKLGPNQASITQVIQNMSSESKSFEAQVLRRVELLNKNQSEEALLIKKHVSNKAIFMRILMRDSTWQQSPLALGNFLAKNIQEGIRPSILNLNSQEYFHLFNFLMRLQ